MILLQDGILPVEIELKQPNNTLEGLYSALTTFTNQSDADREMKNAARGSSYQWYHHILYFLKLYYILFIVFCFSESLVILTKMVATW